MEISPVTIRLARLVRGIPAELGEFPTDIVSVSSQLLANGNPITAGAPDFN
jgi:hypothetical protein